MAILCTILLSPNQLLFRRQFKSDLTDIVFYLQMETIPETICGNLVGVGYDSFDKLPKEKNMDRWREVKTGCGLTGPERTQLMNITFPVQQGKNSLRGIIYYFYI
jgi:hypothetical protein